MTNTATRPRRMAREPQFQEPPIAQNANEAATAIEPKRKRPSKTSLVLELLTQPEGATIDQLVAATGWLPHSTRAALTGLKKKGHAIVSRRTDKLTTYFLA
jgi:hypothetical protein